MRALPLVSGTNGDSGYPFPSTYSWMKTLIVPWLSMTAVGYAFDRGVIGWNGYTVCGASYARSMSATG